MDITVLLPPISFEYIRYKLGASGLDEEDSWYAAQQVWFQLKGLIN